MTAPLVAHFEPREPVDPALLDLPLAFNGRNTRVLGEHFGTDHGQLWERVGDVKTIDAGDLPTGLL